MAQRPLLILPKPTTIEKARLGGGAEHIQRPSLGDQRNRLGAKTRSIVESFRALHPTPEGLRPEQIIVLETIGTSVDGLAEAARNIPGLEWIAELDLDDIEPQAGFSLTDDPDRKLTCRLYAFVSNQTAIERLISLWDNWAQNPTQRAASGFGPFKDVFKYLIDLRRWGPEDRIRGTYFVEDLEFQLNEGYGELRFEVELFFRAQDAARQAASQKVRQLAEADGAHAVSEYVVAEIGYHGMLFRMPATNARATLQAVLNARYTRLIQCDHVFFFRPFGQARAPRAASLEGDVQQAAEVVERPTRRGAPIIAVLDGLPLAWHSALTGRLAIDDPEDFAAKYFEPQFQSHGTAMSSIVVHGDLNQRSETLTSPVYTRPIFVPHLDLNGKLGYEGTPDDRLLVDLVHTAVRRLYEPAAGAVAPTVKVVNLALGNPKQPFDHEMSPLARLLDWLAWKYRVLFVVSSGNHEHDLVVDCHRDALNQLDPKDLAARSIQHMIDNRSSRRVLSPAESMNAITVGAIHSDLASTFPVAARVDIHGGGRLPSPLSAIGAGFRRSVKPDVFLPGGRIMFRVDHGFTGDGTSLALADGSGPPGIKVATPGIHPGELTRATWTCGSSNAAALASHVCGMIHERLSELRKEDTDFWDDVEESVLLKCLLVHGAAWRNAGETIETVFRELVEARYPTDAAGKRLATEELRRLKADLLGYGEVDPSRCIFATDERVSMIGWSQIGDDEGQQFDIPLPAALSAQRVLRTLTITLSWLTPVNPRHRLLRQAQLWFDVTGENHLANETVALDARAARRGTVEHRILTGIRATPIGDEATLGIRVNCKAEAGKLVDRIPYALAVTIEVAEPLAVSIYDEIAGRIRTRQAIHARA